LTKLKLRRLIKKLNMSKLRLLMMLKKLKLFITKPPKLKRRPTTIPFMLLKRLHMLIMKRQRLRLLRNMLKNHTPPLRIKTLLRNKLTLPLKPMPTLKTHKLKPTPVPTRLLPPPLRLTQLKLKLILKNLQSTSLKLKQITPRPKLILTTRKLRMLLFMLKPRLNMLKLT